MYARKRLGTHAYINLTAEVLQLLSILHIEEVTAILRCLALKGYDTPKHLKGDLKVEGNYLYA
jgi:hypothetical protein